MDIISNLPDGVISHILSFLPIKKAAQTSVLSKRWLIQFAFSPNLDLSDYYHDDSRTSFVEFLDRVLAVSRNSPIKRLSLRCRECIDPAHNNRWITDVLNRGVLDLYLQQDLYANRDMFSLPFEIFASKTLVKLKLTDFPMDELPEDALLPSLKTLSLKMLFYSLCVCAFEKLVSVCPVLEDLTIDDLNWECRKCSRTISSPTLERLTLKRSDLNGFDRSDFRSVTFDTPNLTYLYYSDLIADSYQIVSLNSLVEANLCLHPTWIGRFADENDHITSNPTSLIKELRNVKIMNLLAPVTLEMFYIFREAIPVFENLSQLSIRMVSDCGCWRGLQFLLKNSPNLETLIIKGCVHYDKFQIDLSLCECLSEYSFLLSCPVKVLKITEYNGTTEELEHMKHFLEKLSCLEMVQVRAWATTEEAKLKLATDLLKLPGGCKTKLKFIP